MGLRARCAVLILAAAAIVGCSTTTEVVLGAIVSLQGPAASYGNSIQRGIEVAVDKINAEGGVTIADTDILVPIRFEIRDAQSNPQTGLQQAQELIALGVPAVIGADSSDVTLAIADVFQSAETVLLSPASSTPALSDKGTFIYRNYPSDELEAVNMANHIYNVAGVHSVDVISSQSEYGLGIKRAFIQRFRSLGGRLGEQPSFPADSTDVSSQVQELVGSGAEGIYIAGYSAETAVAAGAIRAAGIELPLFGTGATLAAELIAAGGDDVEGLVFPTPAFDPESTEENVREFIAGYRAKYGEGFDVYAAHAYDAVLILVQAIEQEGYRADAISFYLNAMNAYPGAAGETTFDEDGNAVKYHRMFVVQDGQAVPFVAGSATQ
jgi:branched-chain amino acid transport system substrate-binding protein